MVRAARARHVSSPSSTAMKACCDDIISNAIQVCMNNGNPVAFVVLERGSGYYYPLELFERFEWPYLQRYVDALVSEGLTPFAPEKSIHLPSTRNSAKAAFPLESLGR